MSTIEIDLAVCEREPIHQLGLVQPHGALAVLTAPGPGDESDGTDRPTAALCHWSANLPGLCGLRPEALTASPEGFGLLQARADVSLSELIAGLAAPVRRTAAGGLGLPGDRRPVWFTAHRSGEFVIVEIEPVTGAAAPAKGAPETETEIVAALQPAAESSREASGASLFAFCRRLAELCADWFGYDRVMIYRFHPDWSGEVLTEVRPSEMQPYLGLRYPASDIPPQARQLYLEVPVRVIADVAAVPIPLVPRADAGAAQPVTLSQCRLRSVSPYHIEYLRNMEVGATLVTSLLVQGRLWGLIACHHRTARRVAPAMHDLAERLTRVAGQMLERLLAAEGRAQIRRTESLLARLTRNVGSLEEALRRLLFGGPRLSEATRCLAAGVYAQGVSATAGATPPPAWIEAVLQAVAARTTSRCVAIPSLGDWDAAFGDQRSLASGLLVAFVSRQPLAALFCFRPELTREVLWGGDPTHPVELDRVTGRISPRRSFRAWRQNVTGQARPWEAGELAFMERVLDFLVEVAQGERGKDAANGIAEALRTALERLGAHYEEADELRADFLDAALEGMALTVAIDDRETARTVTTNNAFREVFEFQEDAAIGTPLPELLEQIGLPPDAVEGLSEEPREVTAWARTLGPRTLLIHRRTMFVLRTETRMRTWAVLIFQDITGFQRVSESLRAERDRAALSAQAKSQFLATVSHELRTPLNAIIGFSDLMRGSYGGTPLTPADVVRNADHVYTAGRHLLGLIDDLLELSSRESGHRELKETSFDLRTLVRDTCDWVERQGSAAGIAFERKLDGEALPFKGEVKAIRQALINILSNAFKFTNPGGTVTCILGDLSDGTLVLTVRDSGVGIPAEKIETAFKPFEQLDSGLGRQHGGIGLGLPLARSLVELHGGTVNMASSVGKGTTVTIALPAWRRA